MNTYILPYSDGQEVWIEKVRARSLNEAKDKFMERSINNWDIDVPADWEDYKEILATDYIIFGQILDIEEL